MPSPARSTGTTSGGRGDCDAHRSDPSGCVMSIGSASMSRVASYTRMPDEVVHGPPEPGPVGALVPEAGEELGGERVVDHGDLHGGMMAADGPRHARRHDRPHAAARPRPPPREVVALCEEATDLGVAAVCVSPSHLPITEGLGVGIDVAAVIGFPSGAHQPAVKAHEAEVAVDAGATELDMVVNLGLVEGGRSGWRSGDDIAAVRASTPGARRCSR